MEKKFSENLISKDSIAKDLLDCFEELQDLVELGEANLYYKYPFYTNENKDFEVRADFLAITQKKDVHIFSCIPTFKITEIEQIKEKLESLYTIIDSKLRNKQLLKLDRDELKFKLYTHVFCEDYEVPKLDNSIIVFKSKQELTNYFVSHGGREIEKDEFRLITSVIEGIDESVSVNKREITKPKSRGDILSSIESSILNYDVEQFKAITTKVEGFQRIRGLAGTGKTIILARKVAELHRDNPEMKILYTYYTKALNEIVIKHISRYYKKFSNGKEPNWENIDVIHSWGGNRLEGVYYKMCKRNNVEPIDFGTAKIKSPKNPFEYVCKDLLNKAPLFKYYDYILIDEGQDFKENFYRLCLNIVKNNNIIWAYDDFQDILKTDVQDEKLLFGKIEDTDNYYVDFDNMDNPNDHDIILKKCYRNSKKVLTGAFSLGMGVYNEVNNDKIGINVLQRIETKRGWEDIGFEVLEGNCQENEKMSITRPIKNSPDYKEEFLEDSILNFTLCESIQEECVIVSEKISEDLSQDLRAEDICVICLDNININDYYNCLVEMLNEKGIRTFNLQNTVSTNVRFTREGCITLSSIYKAKGNEAGSVYIMGVDAIFKSSDDVYERNKLFTAITRSKGWVHITGTGEIAEKCKREIELLSENNDNFVFFQPSGDKVRTIKQMSGKINKKKDLLSRNLREIAIELGLSVEDYIKQYLLKE